MKGKTAQSGGTPSSSGKKRKSASDPATPSRSSKKGKKNQGTAPPAATQASVKASPGGGGGKSVAGKDATRDKSGKKSKKGGAHRKWGLKQVLASPYAPVFPAANARAREAVPQLLRQAGLTDFARRVRHTHAEKPTAAPGAAGERDNVTAEVEAAAKTTKTQMKQKKKNTATKGAQTAGGATCAKPRGLLVGVNEVTRALERSAVRVVVVSRDVRPGVLVGHLPALCFVRGARLVVMSGDGRELGDLLGMKLVAALGVSSVAETPCAVEDQSGEAGVRVDERVRALGDRLLALAEDLRFPWLQAARDAVVCEGGEGGGGDSCGGTGGKGGRDSHGRGREGGGEVKLPEALMVPHRGKDVALAPVYDGERDSARAHNQGAQV